MPKPVHKKDLAVKKCLASMKPAARKWLKEQTNKETELPPEAMTLEEVAREMDSISQTIFLALGRLQKLSNRAYMYGIKPRQKPSACDDDIPF